MLTKSIRHVCATFAMAFSPVARRLQRQCLVLVLQVQLLILPLHYENLLINPLFTMFHFTPAVVTV